jgi:deoxycytidylate deaminase
MASKPQTLVANDAAEEAQVDEKLFDVDHRKSLELVIAFVGPVGSGVSTVCKKISDAIHSDYGYDPVYIKMSDLIASHAHEVGVNIPADIPKTDRIDLFQNAGDELRTKSGEAYLANRAIEQIAVERENRGGYRVVNEKRILIPIRRVYFVDSIKNPGELLRLRQVYKDLLWVVSVFAPEDLRHERLKAGEMTEDDARHAMRRDYEEEQKTGQKVSKTAHQADYFVRNNTDLKDDLDAPVKRFLETIFGTKLHTPTADEKGMMEAASAAVRSACLSRQVGAAIYDIDGDLLGVGCNDVPRFQGGLYTEGANDNRCYHWKDKTCHNDERKKDLATKIAASLGNTTKNGVKLVEDILESGVNSLIEFSRSVHAEMEAIVSVARLGNGSTVGSTLYTTTFPCHNCARHIVAAGIETVYYIEPYSKSLAVDLHSDAISLSETCRDKVRFLQYQGFSPRMSIRLFSSAGRERKFEGKLIEISAQEATPIFSSPLDSYTTSENLIIQQLQSGGKANA